MDNPMADNESTPYSLLFIGAPNKGFSIVGISSLENQRQLTFRNSMKLCVLQKLQLLEESLLVDAASIAQETS